MLNIPNFQHCARCEKDFNDNKDNSPPFWAKICSDICPWILSVPRSSLFPSSFALGKLFGSRNRQCPRTNIRAYFRAKWRLLFIYFSALWRHFKGIFCIVLMTLRPNFKEEPSLLLNNCALCHTIPHLHPVFLPTLPPRPPQLTKECLPLTTVTDKYEFLCHLISTTDRVVPR